MARLIASFQRFALWFLVVLSSFALEISREGISSSAECLRSPLLFHLKPRSTAASRLLGNPLDEIASPLSARISLKEITLQSVDA